MAASRFTERSQAVLEALLNGASIGDAATHAGVAASTISNWLKAGRREPASQHGPFAQAVDASRSARKLPPRDELDELTEEEARLLLTKLARRGNIQAVKLYLDRFLRPEAEAMPSEASAVLVRMDDLARRRRQHG